MPTVTLKDIQKMIADAAGKAVADAFAAGREAGVERQHTRGLRGPAKIAAPGATRGHPFAQTKYSMKAVEDMTAVERGNMAARCIRYLLACGNDPFRAIDTAAHYGDKILAETWEKALSESVFASGGALLPAEFSSAIIEELGAKAVVRKMGVSTMPMVGSLTLPYFDSSMTAGYVGENSNITKSEPTFGQLQLSDKKLAALVPLSNDLLRTGGSRVDNAVRSHMVRVMGRKEDITFIRSDGSSNEPRGMLYWAVSGNKFNSAGTSLANVTSDLGNCIYYLESNNVELDSAGWLLSPRSKKALITMRDSNGHLVFKPEMDTGKLFGYPFAVTSQIPENLGGGSNQSEVYFAAFDALVISENESLMVEAFPGGAYYDGSAVQSGISQDQTVIRAIALHDFGAQYRGKEISVCQQVTWS
jgi:HK97 family phage major capsid protein